MLGSQYEPYPVRKATRCNLSIVCRSGSEPSTRMAAQIGNEDLERSNYLGQKSKTTHLPDMIQCLIVPEVRDVLLSDSRLHVQRLAKSEFDRSHGSDARIVKQTTTLAGFPERLVCEEPPAY